ncbi:late exocytosis, associated with Golgi transport-domain-containing protein [Chytridium lagenaria]|nr:late exocytosis, associated with Golgi transport-domain-containing protein [Chytridium lagenaria]
MSDPGGVPGNGELGDTTLAALVSAFAINGALAVLFITGFIILRPRFPHTYAPRVISVPEKERSPELPATALGFLEAFKTSDITLLKRMGPDAYATIYFTRTLALLFIGLGVFSSIVLLPIHIYGGNNLEGLNALTVGNVIATNLLWVHFVVITVVTGATIYTIYKLIALTARLRQHYQASSEKANSLAARTLMIRDVTNDIRSPLEIARLFDRIAPGSVHTVVIPRRVPSQLSKLVMKRTWKQYRLEEAITKYVSASAEEAHLGNRPLGGVTKLRGCCGKRASYKY